MRIIAGKYRSRILKSLKGLALRPTSDHLREALFDLDRTGEPLVHRKTIQIVCKLDGSRKSLFDLELRLTFLAQCPQHAMRQYQLFDVCLPGNLPNHRRRHVQISFHSGGAFGHGVVSDEQIRVRRQLWQP